ncbi:MAG: hypothetical protein ABUL60_00240 [Myxococcales bacterium]
MLPKLRQWLGPLAITMLVPACGNAVARPVTTPSGRRGFAIDCRRNQNNCFEKAGEVCPQGYEIVDDARGTTGVQVTSGYATGISIDKKFAGQLLIACSTGEDSGPAETRYPDTAERTGPVRSSRAARARYAASAPPTGALGVRLGSTLDEFDAACEVAGRSYEPRATGGHCDGVITSADFSATTTVTSCDKKICYILLEIGFNSVSDSDVPRVIGRLRDQLLHRYSAPTEVRFEVPDACSNSLVQCLREDRAHIALFWAWETGEVVNFVVTQTSILLGYGNREGVRARTATGL